MGRPRLKNHKVVSSWPDPGKKITKKLVVPPPTPVKIVKTTKIFNCTLPLVDDITANKELILKTNEKKEKRFMSFFLHLVLPNCMPHMTWISHDWEIVVYIYCTFTQISHGRLSTAGEQCGEMYGQCTLYSQDYSNAIYNAR